MEPWQENTPDVAPAQVVGTAIQDMTAVRLGRGFVPLALLAATGILELAFGGSRAMALLLGAPATAGAMLAYGLRIVERAFGRPERIWMSAAMLASLLPPLFSLYVIAWRGLREIAVGGWLGSLPGIFFVLVGSWTLRAWMRVVEVERLAHAMSGVGDPGERR